MYLPLFMTYSNRHFVSNVRPIVSNSDAHERVNTTQIRLTEKDDNQSIIIKSYLSDEHRHFINGYRYKENPNPSIFVRLDRYLFLHYDIEFIKRNRPIISVGDHFKVDFNNPFTY
jgi:hypothetical protein